MNRKPTGEKEIFDSIWEEREHVSEISGIQLDQYVHPFYFNMFSHILCKKDYPHFRLESFNIALLTPEEHRIYDSGNMQKRIDYSEKMLERYGVTVLWDLLDRKAEEMKKVYKEIYPSKIVPRGFSIHICNEAAYGFSDAAETQDE